MAGATSAKPTTIVTSQRAHPTTTPQGPTDIARISLSGHQIWCSTRAVLGILDVCVYTHLCAGVILSPHHVTGRGTSPGCDLNRDLLDHRTAGRRYVGENWVARCCRPYRVT